MDGPEGSRSREEEETSAVAPRGREPFIPLGPQAAGFAVECKPELATHSSPLRRIPDPVVWVIDCPILPMKAELVEQAAQVITDPPILINLVSKRVRQLNAGRPALVDRRPGMREADVALTEIIQGKIKVGTGDEPSLS